MENKNCLEIEQALIKALIPCYLRTFGGYKAPEGFPTKEEMASHLVCLMSDYYTQHDFVKNWLLTFLKTGFSKNTVVKLNVGHVENEIIFPSTLLGNFAESNEGHKFLMELELINR